MSNRMTLKSHSWETGLSEAQVSTKQEPILLPSFSEGDKTYPFLQDSNKDELYFISWE